MSFRHVCRSVECCCYVDCCRRSRRRSLPHQHHPSTSPPQATHDVDVPNNCRQSQIACLAVVASMTDAQSRGWCCAAPGKKTRRWASPTARRPSCRCLVETAAATRSRRLPSGAWCVGPCSGSRSRCRREGRGSWRWRRNRGKTWWWLCGGGVVWGLMFVYLLKGRGWLCGESKGLEGLVWM